MSITTKTAQMKARSYFLLLFVSLLSGCGVEDLCSSMVTSTLASPSGETKAVIVQRDCGATTSMAYYVHLISANEEPSDENSVFNSDKTEGISTSWRNDTTLVISYKKARIFNFTNFWQPKTGNPNKEIRVLEISKNQ